MTTKDNAPTSSQTSEGSNQQKIGQIVLSSPRQRRVLRALLASSPGWVSREQLDRIAGSSNSPDVVMRLRGKLGQDAIEMKQVEATDRDGCACKPGRYRLSDQGRARVIQAVHGGLVL